MTDSWFRPEVSAWRGTPIPSVSMPLDPTSGRVKVAEAVWWNGPAWTILRNGPQFVRQVLDFGHDEEVAFIRADVGRRVWVAALRGAVAGSISRGSYILWSIKLGLADAGMECDWPRDAHVRDIRPLAFASREDLYRRHRLRRDRRRRTSSAEA